MSEKVITAIPFGGQVEFVEAVGAPLTLQGQTGQWSKVAYEAKSGYSFGGFLADAPLAEEAKAPTVKVEEPLQLKTNIEKGLENQWEASSSPTEIQQVAFAYARNDNHDLVKMSYAEFEREKVKIEMDFEKRKDEFKNSVPPKNIDESLDNYLARTKKAKEETLYKIRKYEYDRAKAQYSIYDAKLEHGNYSNTLGMLDFIGTTIEFWPMQKIYTIPENRLLGDGFENGRKYSVKMTANQAEFLIKNAEDLLVRIDFGYTESVYNILGWTRKAYFLPKYLMVYNRRTGEIFYECKVSQKVEISPDLAAPLEVTGEVLDETVD